MGTEPDATAHRGNPNDTILKDQPCRQCEYNLRGLPVQGRCPECGHQYGFSPVITTIVDDTGTVITDLTCRRCGYNLRGLNQTGRCPECGVPIGLSCHGDLLRYCDPGWLDTLAKGARFILWGVLAVVVAVALGAVLSIVLATRSELIMGSLALIGGLVGYFGTWLITEPDPGGLGEDKYVTDRKLIRIALLFGLAGSVLGILQHAVDASTVLVTLLGVASGAASLIAVVGEFAKLTYFAKLARRIPDVKLTQWARSLRWALAGSLAVLTIGGVGVALMIPSGGMAPGAGAGGRVPVGLIGFGCVAGLAGLVYFIISILILILVYRLGQAFKAQAQFARQLRAEAEAGAAPGPALS